jgi:hypothetical protein
MSEQIDAESWPNYKRSILGRMDAQDEELKAIRDEELREIKEEQKAFRKEQQEMKEALVEMRTSAKTILIVLGCIPTVISVVGIVISVWSALRAK